MIFMKPPGRIAEEKDTYLVYLTPQMVTEKYVAWLNDEEVNRYLEVRFGMPHTIESVIDFVKSNYDDPYNHLFAIMLLDGDSHIGNIKVGPVNRHHRFAEVGLMIGEKSCWGKGYGSQAIKMASEYAFRELGLHKLIAGIYENNIASIKAFERAGYSYEGSLKKKFLCNGKYVDQLLFGKINDGVV